MPHRWWWNAALIVCLAGALVTAAAGQTRSYRQVERLHWAGPPGSMPGSYEDFIAAHGLHQQPPLKIQPVHRTFGKSLDNHVLIVVEEALYPQIETALLGYVSDLEFQGYAVAVVLDTAFGGTPMEFRDYLGSVYISQGLVGALLIGDLPVAWHESTWDDGTYEEYPCDYFFMDLDGTWSDSDVNGIYDIHSGDRLPEIWVGRMTASTLGGDEADYINGLLAKIAAYRDGLLSQPRRGITFIDDDWSSWETCGMDSIYGPLVKVSNDHQTTVADTYAVELGTGYETVQVCAHSWPEGHQFSSRPCDCASYAHAYVESDSARNCDFRIQGQDGFKVWLNGSEILTDPDGTNDFLADVVSATLDSGTNNLLVKVVQDKDTYKFSARLCDSEGYLIPGISTHLEDPAGPVRHAPYISAWLTNGFHYWSNFWGALSHDFLEGEADIDAYEGLISGGQTWQLWDIGSGYLDFSTLYSDMDVGAVYAFTHVYSDSARPAALWLGTYSGAKVWLNGAVVYYNNTYHDYEADAQQIALSLEAGWNRLLVKISVWYGAELSGRVGDDQKLALDGLAYDPAPTPSQYIHGWLTNGIYKNHNASTRLTQDYLGGEATVTPAENDSSGLHRWKPGFAGTNWFDLETHFSEDGGSLSSNDIQTIDPDGILYNLFACSAARFTESNYIAGRYTFADTYGLAAIGSAKSGSMLYFEDFYEQLGRGRCLGKAFQEWFRNQGTDGFDNWEVCWYYGMALIGDPLLQVNVCSPPQAVDDLTGILSKEDVSLRWTEPFSECGISGYIIYRSSAAELPGDSLAGTPDITFTDPGATGTDYYYTVKAIDTGGQKSEESNRVGEFNKEIGNAK